VSRSGHCTVGKYKLAGQTEKEFSITFRKRRKEGNGNF